MAPNKVYFQKSLDYWPKALAFTLSANMFTKSKVIIYIIISFGLKAKSNLFEGFQPDGVFHFENRASVYFDTLIS